MAIALSFAGAIALQDSYAARPCVQSAPFEMMEMDKSVSGKRGWGDTRVNGICRMGDAKGRLRLRPSERAIG